MPAREAVFYDLVHGETRFDTSLFGDLVLLKSDGFPTYHFACVVDDHDMQISHVIRGDDHLSNTPRQIVIFECLGWKPPKYAHLPLILGSDGSPLSKRHGAVALSSFREQGFIPEGILNYLALLGWGTDGNQEFYTLETLAKKFSLKRVNKASARFDYEKLAWMNGQHLKQLPDEEFARRLSAFYRGKFEHVFNPEDWVRLARLYKGRLKTLRDLEAESPYLFCEPDYAAASAPDLSARAGVRDAIAAWAEEAARFEDFRDAGRLEASARGAAERAGLKAADLIHPLRYALTAKTVSPGLFELMSVLGKDKCLARVRQFLSSSVT
jgi:glutamyl-tRNA synthetase